MESRTTWRTSRRLWISWGFRRRFWRAIRGAGRVERLVYLDTAFGYVAPGLEEKIALGIAGLSSKDPMASMERWRA